MYNKFQNTIDLNVLFIHENNLGFDSIKSILDNFSKKITLLNLNDLENFTIESKKFDLVIFSNNQDEEYSLKLLESIKKNNPKQTIISVLNNESYNNFVKLINLNIDGYIPFPVDKNQVNKLFEKVFTNILIKKEYEQKQFLEQYKDITDNSSMISILDTKGKILYVNESFCRISEYSYEELIGKDYHSITNYQQPPELFHEIWDTIENKKQIWQGVIKNLSKNGNPYYLKTTIKPILDENGQIKEYIALRDDITEILNQNKQLEDYIDTIDEAVIVLVKIEAFDDIKKYYGNSVSKILEDQYSNELLSLMPRDCEFKKVFALGQGLYAFAKDKNDCKIAPENVVKQLKKFQQKINDLKIPIDEFDYDITVQISLAYGNDALQSAKYGLKELLKDKQDFIVANNLSQKEHEEVEQNIKTIKMLKKAIDSYNIISYFQPIIDNKTQQVVKYESLVRLVDENNDIVLPYYFLDIAKKGKYYSQITSLVLENSFDALKDTKANISINISALDIEKRLTRDKIFSLLNQYKNDTHRIVFELLEDESVKDFKTIKEFITKVKKMGVQIAIDDFGAGYSNFERLLDYQPDILKLDGSLVKNIASDKFSLNVVETIIEFAKKQNIKTIAEFVENEEIYNILCELGIDYSQGYFFGRPEKLERQAV